jgi:hypothetical protein
MNIRLLVLCGLLIGFSAGSLWAETPPRDSAAAKQIKATPRSLTVIQTDVRAALRAEAETRRAGHNAPQVLRLVTLYREMASHPQRDKSPMLKELGQQVRSRLATVRERIKRQIADGKKPVTPKSISSASNRLAERVLAQQVPQQGQAGVAGQNAIVVGQTRARATTTDYGPELVELIEATISPEIWNINGGPGAIVYYSPLHVLVVSAPDEVHSQIGDAVGQLRAAQRQLDGAQVVAQVGVAQGGNRFGER